MRSAQALKSATPPPPPAEKAAYAPDIYATDYFKSCTHRVHRQSEVRQIHHGERQSVDHEDFVP